MSDNSSNCNNNLMNQYTICDISDYGTSVRSIMCDISDGHNNIMNIDNSTIIDDNTSVVSGISDSLTYCNNSNLENNSNENENTDINNIYLENLYNTVNLAVLMNTKYEHCENIYENIMLPVMNIDYKVFLKFIYINKSRNLSCNLIDDIYRQLNFQLNNEFLLHYSKKFSVDINKINPTTKIKLTKECSFKNLSDRMVSCVSLNKQEFIDTLKNNMSKDNVCLTDIILKIYSESLKIGINLIFRFKIENICL